MFANDSCLFFPAKESDFDLKFNSKSTANYAEYTSMPSLTALTACVWGMFSSSAENVYYFFTYSASSANNEALTLGYVTSEAKLWTRIATGGWK